MSEQSQPVPRLILAFQAYTPPFNAEEAVHRMLKIVPSQHLWGLDSIVLTNVPEALARTELEQRTLGRRRVPLKDSLGYYKPAWHGQPAQITLLVDNLERYWKRIWLRFGVLRDGALAEVLYYELGNHVQQLHVPEYEGKKHVAEQYSAKFTRKFVTGQRWYLSPLAAPLTLLVGLWNSIARIRHRIRN